MPLLHEFANIRTRRERQDIVLMAEIQSAKKIHIIPLENDENDEFCKPNALLRASRPSKKRRVESQVSDDMSQDPLQFDAHVHKNKPGSKNGVVKLLDPNNICVSNNIDTLESSRQLILKIGSSIVMQQVSALSTRLEKYNDITNPSKNESLDLNGGSHTSLAELACRKDFVNIDHEESITELNERNGRSYQHKVSDSDTSEEEQYNILAEAARMKRVSIMFRDLDFLYCVILNELRSSVE